MKDFGDDDLRTFSDFIAKLYRCDFCHNPDLAGRDNVPRIAG
jgi:hypothetical protein